MPNKEVIRLEQSKIKNLTSSLIDFRNQCKKKGISTKEFDEDESIRFIIDKYKRFFFKSKLAQKLDNINNFVASTSLRAWAFRADGILGTRNRFLLAKELSKSLLPIVYITSLKCLF